MNRFQFQPTFLADILWMDKECFSPMTMDNKQNIHSWALENPRCAVEIRHQVRWSINIWCGMYKINWFAWYFARIPILGTFGGCNIRLCRRFVVEWPPEFMVPTRQRISSQMIKCPAVSSGYIPAINHRVWWLCRMSTFTWPESIGLFSAGIQHQAVIRLYQVLSGYIVFLHGTQNVIHYAL